MTCVPFIDCQISRISTKVANPESNTEFLASLSPDLIFASKELDTLAIVTKSYIDL